MTTSSCEKMSYITKGEAKRESKRQHRRFHCHSQPYKCPDCGMWHLTTQKSKTINLIQSGKADFVGRLSKIKTVWRVAFKKEVHLVTYNKKDKTCKINHIVEKVK